MAVKTLGPYTLYSYQETGVKFITSRKYALLADEPGLGKTIQSLEAALQLGVKRLIIICPGFLCAQWKQEADKFYGPYGISTFIMDSKLDCLPVQFTAQFILICSYDMAWRRMALLASTNYDFAIIDESHFLKNSKAKRTKILLGKGSFLARTNRALLMTGTPMLNKPIDLYTILRNFVPEVLKQYVAWPLFVSRFCGYMMKGSKNEEQLSGMLKTFMLRRKLEDVIEELPDVILSKIPFSDVKIAPEFEYSEVVIQRREVAIAKLPQTIQYLEGLLQSTSKIVVVCYHRNTIETLVETFKEQKAVAIYGGISEKVRTERLSEFISGEAELLFAQISTIGVGVDGLQRVSNRIVFAESDWSPSIIQQAIARLKRIGQESGTVFVDFLICEGTIEEDIDFSLIKKEEMIDSIVGGTFVPKGLEEMPYGYNNTEWRKLSEKSRDAIAANGKNPNDNGHAVASYYEQQQTFTQKEKEKQMAKPPKNEMNSTSTGGKGEHIKKAEEFLCKAITTFVSALVHDLMNGGVPESFVSAQPPISNDFVAPGAEKFSAETIKIAGNVVPTEERTIPTVQLPSPVVTAPTAEYVSNAVGAFRQKLKELGLTDEQSLAAYKGLSTYPGKKMAETTDEERTKLSNELSSVSHAFLQSIVASFAPPTPVASTDDI